MRVSKSLLKTIALGLTISATTSCGLVTDTMEDVGHSETCVEGCDDKKCTTGETMPFSCPACGMG